MHYRIKIVLNLLRTLNKNLLHNIILAQFLTKICTPLNVITSDVVSPLLSGSLDVAIINAEKKIHIIRKKAA